MSNCFVWIIGFFVEFSNDRNKLYNNVHFLERYPTRISEYCRALAGLGIFQVHPMIAPNGKKAFRTSELTMGLFLRCVRTIFNSFIQYCSNCAERLLKKFAWVWIFVLNCVTVWVWVLYALTKVHTRWWLTVVLVSICCFGIYVCDFRIRERRCWRYDTPYDGRIKMKIFIYPCFVFSCVAFLHVLWFWCDACIACFVHEILVVAFF